MSEPTSEQLLREAREKATTRYVDELRNRATNPRPFEQFELEELDKLGYTIVSKDSQPAARPPQFEGDEVRVYGSVNVFVDAIDALGMIVKTLDAEEIGQHFGDPDGYVPACVTIKRLSA